MYNLDNLYNDFLIEAGVDLPETMEKDRKVTQALCEHLGKENYTKSNIDTLVSASQEAFQHQGFIWGFQVAVSLLTGSKGAM